MFTIIDIWDEGGIQECWVANFSDIGEAKKCFFDHIHHHDPDLDDTTIQIGFEDCLSGVGFAYDGKSVNGTLFLRKEVISDKFDPKKMPWA